MIAGFTSCGPVAVFVVEPAFLLFAGPAFFAAAFGFAATFFFTDSAIRNLLK